MANSLEIAYTEVDKDCFWGLWAQFLTEVWDAREIVHEHNQQVDKYSLLSISLAGSPEGLADTSQSSCSLAKKGLKMYWLYWLWLSEELPLLYQACCMSPLEVKMKSNNNSQDLLYINSIPDSGLASNSIWSSPQPFEVGAYLILILDMRIMRHREYKELAQDCTTRKQQNQALNSRACALSHKPFLVAACHFEVRNLLLAISDGGKTEVEEQICSPLGPPILLNSDFLTPYMEAKTTIYAWPRQKWWGSTCTTQSWLLLSRLRSYG